MWCWARPNRNTCECALHVREHVQNTGAELTRDITAAMQGAKTQGLTHEHNHMSKWDGGNNDCAPWDMQLRWLTGVRQPEVNHSFQVWFVTLLVIVITLLRRHIRRRQRHNWLSEPMRQWVSAWWQTAGKKNRQIYSDVFFSLSRWGWSTFLFLSEQIKFVETIFLFTCCSWNVCWLCKSEWSHRNNLISQFLGIFDWMTGRQPQEDTTHENKLDAQRLDHQKEAHVLSKCAS